MHDRVGIHVHLLVCVDIHIHNYMLLNKNTLGIKKVQGQSEAALQAGRCDQKLCISAEARSYFIMIITLSKILLIP